MIPKFKISGPDLSRLRKPSSITEHGLVIGGSVQCFSWERNAQERFAKLAASGASHVVNVGYGLGYAQEVFERIPDLRIDLIEINPSVIARARRRSRLSKTCFHLAPWQEALPAVNTSSATIFFDAFPIEQTFDYSAESFIRYIDPFMEVARGLRWHACYFIAFDQRVIGFPSPTNMRVHRIAKAKLPPGFRKPGLTTISLYQISHVMVNDRYGRVACMR